jgi:hypothetical protein
MRRDGVPMAIVSRMLRQFSIGITVDTYGHLSGETARTASDAIGALRDAAFEEAARTASERAGDHNGHAGRGGGPRGDR